MNELTKRYLDTKDKLIKETDPEKIKELEQLADRLRKQRLKEMTWKNRDLTF